MLLCVCVQQKFKSERQKVVYIYCGKCACKQIVVAFIQYI